MSLTKDGQPYAVQHGPAELRPWRLSRGKVSRAMRDWIYERDGYRCVDCGSSNPDTLTLDHIIPAVAGGTEWASNLVTTCFPCNLQRMVEWKRAHGEQLWADKRR